MPLNGWSIAHPASLFSKVIEGRTQCSRIGCVAIRITI